MFLNDYAKTTLICCFCETTFPEGSVVCNTCQDYKGMMTIADFNEVYGE